MTSPSRGEIERGAKAGRAFERSDLRNVDLAGAMLVGIKLGWSELGRISNSGTCSAQMSCAFQQRVRNRQPDGGLTGEGTSPVSRMIALLSRTVGSGTGTAESSAWVYGWVGRS